MSSIGEQIENLARLNQVAIPDLWQQAAVSALRAGQDVVVQAPTGAGKTLIFELWTQGGRRRGQAIYTVPTRALANDKLAEWRARGWDVGIATGDLAENLQAPVVVATLETQKNRLINGDGPSLLVVDEYQMIADPDRGLNYELAIALAPATTQLLLLSGSVSNPQDVVKWLRRLGRNATLVRDDIRPVPLDEVFTMSLDYHLPDEIRGYWPRLCAKALAEGLGPILVFAPRRQGAEELAADLARQLPCPNPLTLTPEQRELAGDHLAKLLKARVTYHHSGLSYGVRAGVIEPLAKAGQLRVVVATMGLAAGINFSLRSVALAGESYRRDNLEVPLSASEILQMHGRAGRRGIDETGYVLIAANELRLHNGHTAYLSRGGLVDWSALLSIMSGAAAQGLDPFAEAVRVQKRLFTAKPVHLGVEDSLENPSTPCGLRTDSERARHVRQRVREILNSHGEWEPMPSFIEKSLRDIAVMEPLSELALNLLKVRNALPPSARGASEPIGDGQTPASVSPSRIRLRPILSHPPGLEKSGHGTLVEVNTANGHKEYGRSFTVAEILHDGRINLVKWVRRLTDWNGRQAPLDLWQSKIAPLTARKLADLRTPVLRFETEKHKILAVVSLADLPLRVPVDRHGVAIWKPIERQVMLSDCARCPLVPRCEQLPAGTGVALLWRRLGLVDASGRPTRRGQVVSLFTQGDGLAIAAALEDEKYALDELIYDLANLDAGFRFCGDENRWAGQLAMACGKMFNLQTIPGYLENGLPPRYGAGAEVIVAAVHKNPLAKYRWVNHLIGVGDIDRVIIEWRSLLRQIAHAPPLDWPRWTSLQHLAKAILNETASPTLTNLPPLDYSQTKRIDHRLVLRRR